MTAEIVTFLHHHVRAVMLVVGGAAMVGVCATLL